MSTSLPVVKVVGVSASGKSTLVKALRALGYEARPVSQEHSSVPDLWKQFDFPKVLIYLDATLETQRQRRDDVTWDEDARKEELSRLAAACENADLQIDTSKMDVAGVLQVASAYLRNAKIRHADAALLPIQATGSSLRPE